MRREFVRRLFWIALALTLATLSALATVDRTLRTETSPHGIVSFEFCGYDGSCPAIVERWGEQGRVMAGISLGLDYLFMVLYPATIFLGLLLVAERVPLRFKAVTVLAAWSAWGAGLFDAVENYCLVQTLLRSSPGGYPLAASVLATLKFATLAATLGWLLIMALWFGRRRVAQRRPS